MTPEAGAVGGFCSTLGRPVRTTYDTGFATMAGWVAIRNGRAALLGDRIMISVADKAAQHHGANRGWQCATKEIMWLAPKNKAEAHAHKRVGLCFLFAPVRLGGGAAAAARGPRVQMRMTRLCCASADPPCVLESEQSQPAARLISSGRGAFLLCWWLSSRMLGAFVGGFGVKLRGPIRGARLLAVIQRSPKADHDSNTAANTGQVQVVQN
jgi:hypothetical protein